MQTIVCSPSFPESEARTLKNFKNYYLDGDRNVDGIIWETVDCSNFIEEKRVKEITEIDDIQFAMDIQNKAVQSGCPNVNERNPSTRKEESKIVFENESAIAKIDNQQIKSK